MSYPETLVVSLVETGGSSCGSLSHELEFQDSSSPPEYREKLGGGDFAYVRCYRHDSTTWRMTIVNISGGCAGTHDMQRTASGDDPTGDYCGLSGGSPNCSISKATVSEP